MIRSFADDATAQVAAGFTSRRLPPDLQRSALRKLRLLARARVLDDLQALPGSRLEALSGKRFGTYSIRINDQWRICFRWENGNAYDVEIVDYH